VEKDSFFQRIFAEICLGYSEQFWKNSKIYIKHLSNLDSIELDGFYESFIKKSQESGIKTYNEKIKWLIEKKMWSLEKDIEVKQQEDYVDSLQQTHEKLIFKSQKAEVEKNLKEETKKLNILLEEKENLIGITAERIANQKIQFYCIYVSFFKDTDLKQKLFTLEEIDNLDDEDSSALLQIYIDIIDKYNLNNIKKVAISNYFTNNFYICGENLQSFFGKPIYLLTNYQSNLLSLGSYFRSIFSQNSDLPKEIRGDPEKIEQYVKKSHGLKDMMSKIDPNTQSVGIVAGNQDFEEMGLKRDLSVTKSDGPINQK
jgi:hypothetical protein